MPAVVKGTIVSIPQKTESGVEFEIELEKILIEKKLYSVPGHLLVSLRTLDGIDKRINGIDEMPRYGELIQVSGTLHVPGSYRNFEGFDYGVYMREKRHLPYSFCKKPSIHQDYRRKQRIKDTFIHICDARTGNRYLEQ